MPGYFNFQVDVRLSWHVAFQGHNFERFYSFTSSLQQGSAL